MGALQQAIDQARATQPLQRKLQEALKDGSLKPAAGEPPIDAALAAGLVDAEGAAQLREAERARRRVIDVDDFAKAELQPSAGKIR
ncbi:hypothetical protein D9M69_714730 [compost metagenome]